MSLEIKSIDDSFVLDSSSQTIAFYNSGYGLGMPTNGWAPDNYLYWNGWTDVINTSDGSWAGSGAHTTGLFQNVTPYIDPSTGVSNWKCMVGDRGSAAGPYDLISLPDNLHSFKVVYTGYGTPTLKVGILDFSAAGLTGNEDFATLFLASRKLQYQNPGFQGWEYLEPIEGNAFFIDYSINSGNAYSFYVCVSAFNTINSTDNYIITPPLQFQIV